jgi:hypothetical protein
VTPFRIAIVSLLCLLVFVYIGAGVYCRYKRWEGRSLGSAYQLQLIAADGEGQFHGDQPVNDGLDRDVI